MSPKNKTKKQHIFLAKKIYMCKQKSNTFFSKNNCACARGKNNAHVHCAHDTHGHFGQPRCTYFLPPPPFPSQFSNGYWMKTPGPPLFLFPLLLLTKHPPKNFPLSFSLIFFLFSLKSTLPNTPYNSR